MAAYDRTIYHPVNIPIPGEKEKPAPLTVRNTVQVNEASFTFTLQDIKHLYTGEVSSPRCLISNLTWRLEVSITRRLPGMTSQEPYLSLFLRCENEKPSTMQWSCTGAYVLTLVNQKNKRKSIKCRGEVTFGPSISSSVYDSWGSPRMIQWSKFTDPKKGFLQGNVAVFRARIRNLSPIMERD